MPSAALMADVASGNVTIMRKLKSETRDKYYSSLQRVAVYLVSINASHATKFDDESKCVIPDKKVLDDVHVLGFLNHLVAKRSQTESHPTFGMPKANSKLRQGSTSKGTIVISLNTYTAYTSAICFLYDGGTIPPKIALVLERHRRGFKKEVGDLVKSGEVLPYTGKDHLPYRSKCTMLLPDAFESAI